MIVIPYEVCDDGTFCDRSEASIRQQPPWANAVAGSQNLLATVAATYSFSTFSKLLPTIEIMADNEDDLVDYDEEEVR